MSLEKSYVVSGESSTIVAGGQQGNWEITFLFT